MQRLWDEFRIMTKCAGSTNPAFGLTPGAKGAKEAVRCFAFPETMNRSLLAGVFLLACGLSAYGQADITFSGGNGSPLTLTLTESVSYTVTQSSSTTAPVFDFQNMGNLFSNPAFGSGTLSFTINGTSYAVDGMDSGGGDTLAFNTTFPGVVENETVTLNAGTFTTTDDYAGAPPSDGNFYTYLTDENSDILSDPGTAIAAPEPSAWIILLAGLGCLFGLRRLARRAS